MLNLRSNAASHKRKHEAMRAHSSTCHLPRHKLARVWDSPLTSIWCQG